MRQRHAQLFMFRHYRIALEDTGSTAVGKSILRSSAETMKRVTLKLGGKSPTVILDDADLEKAIPMAVTAGFANSGQASIAETRILVPEHKMSAAIELIRATLNQLKVGDICDPETAIGPMVSQKQYERVGTGRKKNAPPALLSLTSKNYIRPSDHTWFDL
jgi:acyl-CoA reductase-like NAD-dependent aldehyde dehydrogenase